MCIPYKHGQKSEPALTVEGRVLHTPGIPPSDQIPSTLHGMCNMAICTQNDLVLMMLREASDLIEQWHDKLALQAVMAGGDSRPMWMRWSSALWEVSWLGYLEWDW